MAIDAAALLAGANQPFPAQQFSHGVRCRPALIRLLAFQNRLQLARPPAHVLVPQFHDLLLLLR
jgi:hypothetical protein